MRLFALAAVLATGSVLNPQSAGPVQRAFDRMKPALVWDEIKLQGDHIQAKLCPAGLAKASCFPLRLDAPGPHCAGKISGPFCVTNPNGMISDSDWLVIDSALRTENASEIWTELPGHPTRLAALRADLKGRPLDTAVRLAGVAFLMAVIAAAAAEGFKRRRWLLTPDALLPFGLGGIALAVRTAAIAGPGDVRDVLSPVFSEARAGWSSYIELIRLVLPDRDETFWNLHRLLGALCVPLLYGVVRQRFADRTAAAAAAAALAVMPLAARFAATDTPYTPLMTFFLSACLALGHFRKSGEPRLLALGLALLTIAAQLRPEGLWLCVPAALLTLAVPDGVTRASWRIALPVILFVLINAAFIPWTLGSGVAPLPGTPKGGFAGLPPFVLFGSLVGSPWLNVRMSPWPMIPLLAAGIIFASRQARPGVLWLLATAVAFPLAVHFDGWIPTRDQFADTRYHLPAVYLGCGLIGVGVAGILRLASSASNGVAAAIALAAAIPALSLLHRPFTVQEEFRFYRTEAAKIPEDCTVYFALGSSDLGFVPSPRLGRFRLEAAAHYRRGIAENRCEIFYRGANCFADDNGDAPFRPDAPERSECAAIESVSQLEPLSQRTLPALPFRSERYRVDPLPVGFFRLHERTVR